jgi:hypothetical protein
MPWAEVIAQILKVLGPILSDLLKRWLDTKLKAAARATGVDGPPPRTDCYGILLAAALDATPRRQAFRRAFLRQAIVSVPAAVTAGKLNSADRKELAALAGAADQE